MNHQERSRIKKQIRPMIWHHLSTFILIYLPLAIITIMSFASSKMAQLLPKMLIISFIALIIWCCKKYMSLGIHFTLLDLIRYRGSHLTEFKIPKFNRLDASLTTLKEHHIKDIFCIGFCKDVWSFLWLVLFIMPLAVLRATHTMHQLWWILIFFALPAVIKIGYSYIQAQYIYRDGIKTKQPVSYSGSVSMSKLLMHGHRIEYLILQISCLSWIIIPVAIGAGITYVYTGSLHVTGLVALIIGACMSTILSPYIKIMELIFYQHLVLEQANNGSLFYTEIIDQLNHK